MRTSTALLLLTSILSSGCADAVSPARESYIRAQQHGWVELTVEDWAVPPLPPESTKPIECQLTVSLNGEEFLSEAVYPHGDEPPYRVQSGFRFPAPTGTHNLVLAYSG